MTAAKEQVGTARRRSSSTIELVDADESLEMPNVAASKPAWAPWGSSDPGALDLRVLDQGQWWVDITGTPHLLAQMSATYLGNVEALLVEHAEALFYGYAAWVLRGEIWDALEGRLNPETVARQAGVASLARLDPRTWLSATPLMRALRAELSRRRLDSG